MEITLTSDLIRHIPLILGIALFVTIIVLFLEASEKASFISEETTFSILKKEKKSTITNMYFLMLIFTILLFFGISNYDNTDWHKSDVDRINKLSLNKLTQKNFNNYDLTQIKIEEYLLLYKLNKNQKNEICNIIKDIVADDKIRNYEESFLSYKLKTLSKPYVKDYEKFILMKKREVIEDELIELEKVMGQSNNIIDVKISFWNYFITTVNLLFSCFIFLIAVIVFLGVLELKKSKLKATVWSFSIMVLLYILLLSFMKLTKATLYDIESKTIGTGIYLIKKEMATSTEKEMIYSLLKKNVKNENMSNYKYFMLEQKLDEIKEKIESREKKESPLAEIKKDCLDCK